jgi:hypothetical protein
MLRGLGSFCYGIGWYLFFVCVVNIRDIHPQDGSFQACGYWIVPGWLLLRFADGLFPFSRRFSD